MGSGKLIKKAILKYCIENFTKEYLAFCDTEDKLNWFEKFYIKKYNARENGYNLTEGGDGSLGRKLTEEHKRRISEANKDEKNHFYGVRRNGNKNPFYGKHHSEETKKKISESLKRRYLIKHTEKK